MLSLKKFITIILSYLAVFAGTIIIYGLIQNSGTASGSLQNSSATLPLLYVSSGGSLINETHGYKTAVDSGYYRDSITPVDESRTVNLVIDAFNYNISSASYELYNDQNTDLVEKGDCSEIQKVDQQLECQVIFQSELQSNREYCLHIILKDSSGTPIYYYTRVRYGSDLQVAEKLKFVLDFNEQTFNKDDTSTLENYLESTSTSDATDLSYADIYSSVDTVTWGDLAPSRTSDITPVLREINTETASFTLSYNIESTADDLDTTYQVFEYYRLRIGDDKIYLLDFRRTMQESIDSSKITVENGQIRLGVGDGSNAEVVNYGTNDQSYSYLYEDDQLYLFDNTNNIFTKVFGDDLSSHSCAGLYDQDIKVIHADDSTGDLYFAVYGYIHSGRYEGCEGVLVYHYEYADDLLEQLMFVPYDRGFEQLKGGITKLAYMNDSGVIYLMIENSIYSFNPSTGRMETAYENVDSNACAVSDSGIIAMAEETYSGTGAGTSLRIIDLNSSDDSSEKTLSKEGMLIEPLGYIGSDLVYGLAEKDKISEDSTGTVNVPFSEVHIADSDLNDIKVYSKEGDYIMRADISDNMIVLTLGKATSVDGYTDYEDDGEEQIIHNVDTEEEGNTIVSESADSRCLQYYMKISNASSTNLVPVTQQARQLDPGYDVSKNYVASSEVELRYYVYTNGELAADVATIKEAISYGNEYAGTVMTSHKQVVWQRAGRAYIWDLGVSSVDQVDSGQQNAAIIGEIASYEGWTLNGEVDNSKQLYASMSADLPTETINLTGLDLTDVLHFVYRDRMVVAKTGDNQYVLITGYTNDYITIADFTEGTVSQVAWDTAEAEFKAAGNVFYSYFD